MKKSILDLTNEQFFSIFQAGFKVLDIRNASPLPDNISLVDCVSTNGLLKFNKQAINQSSTINICAISYHVNGNDDLTFLQFHVNRYKFCHWRAMRKLEEFVLMPEIPPELINHFPD